MAENDRNACLTPTGDLHSSIAGEQRRPPDSAPRTPPTPRTGSGAGATEDERGTGGEVSGVGFATPAVTSVNLAEAIGVEEELLARFTEPLIRRIAREPNPHFDRSTVTTRGARRSPSRGRTAVRRLRGRQDRRRRAPKRLADPRVSRDPGLR